jgi:hypothetical protein
MVALVRAPDCLHRWNILGEGSSLAVDACAAGCWDIVRDKRNTLRATPLPFHRAALSSRSFGSLAVRFGSRGIAMDLDPHRDRGWKRAGICAGVDWTQVQGARPTIVISPAALDFSLQIEVVASIM